MESRAASSVVAQAAPHLFLVLAISVLSACDGAAVTELAPALPAVIAGDGTRLSPAAGGVTASSRGHGSVVASTGGAARFDVSFLPADLAPGQALTAALLDGEGIPLATLVSRPVAGGRHAVSVLPGTLRPHETTVEARLEGRFVTSGEVLEGRDGSGGVSSFQEPTSVHYYYYEGRDGGWILGVEYDYDLHGGTTVNFGGEGASVRADRVRFVLRGTQQFAAPAAIRFAGFERFTMLDSSS